MKENKKKTNAEANADTALNKSIIFVEILVIFLRCTERKVAPTQSKKSNTIDLAVVEDGVEIARQPDKLNIN